MDAGATSTAVPQGAPRAAPLELRSGDTAACLQPLGAELVSWTVGGIELLWPGDDRWWARSSPLLFPLVGRLRDGLAWFDGRAHPMAVHGFAAASVFEVESKSPSSATLVLHADALTRVAYPFDFTLTLHCTVAPGEVSMRLTLANPGARPMPWSLGLHPGLRWPWRGGSGAGHALVFEHEEPAEVPVITPQGLFTPQLRPLPMQGRRLPLDGALLADEALCFLGARSRALAFEAPDGSAIEFRADGFDHWALWQPPGAPLLCVEAWTGHGDFEAPAGASPVAFADRPWTRRLAPGASATLALRMRYRAAGPEGPAPGAAP